MEILHEKPLSIRIINLRTLSRDQRKEVLNAWFEHLQCSCGGGHRWAGHRWVPELHAWHWDECVKCGVYRLVQTTGNAIIWQPQANSAEALIFNSDFEEIEHALNEANWIPLPSKSKLKHHES